MLYKKYIIEIDYVQTILQSVNLNSNSMYNNQIQMNLTPVTITVNTIKYLAEDGHIQDYVCFFETYDEAYDILSTHYYTIINNHNVESVNISTRFNDMIPPLEVLRSMKINKLIK
jgi:hypothetical protein